MSSLMVDVQEAFVIGLMDKKEEKQNSGECFFSRNLDFQCKGNLKVWLSQLILRQN